MENLLLLGDEAIAHGGMDAGISGIYAYPGTPSTEIMEYVQNSERAAHNKIFCKWSANEKTAFEAALGMSYAGKRAMVCMKHVGLNVAADPFMNASITGINGGLVIVVADDPSMHSSQNEQDSRFYGKFALIPVLEPSSQQEAYDVAVSGFDLSEKFRIPVMLRLTTRLAHSRAPVSPGIIRHQNNLALPSDSSQFILLPSIARKRYRDLLSLQADLEKESENSLYNKYFDGKDKSVGVIACGLAYNYLMEIYNDTMPGNPVLKISQYPVPMKLIRKIAGECKRLLVLEDGYPLVEEMLRGYNEGDGRISGRLDGSLPRDGELNPDHVARAAGFKVSEGPPVPGLVRNRPPSLCVGCGHIDMYNALVEAIGIYGKGRVFSDIGCYTLGALEPFNAINSCVDMGASITMAKGASDAGLHPSVCVIGDSTFTHSGMTGLLDVVNDNSPVTVIIGDNSITGMTGGQKSSATGRIEEICMGIGVEPSHIRLITPLKKNHGENVAIIAEELVYKGVSVIIARRECIQAAVKRKKVETTKNHAIQL
jgi:indolepyruvate ferredoxin oxidoreductase, alpha subunit